MYLKYIMQISLTAFILICGIILSSCDVKTSDIFRKNTTENVSKNEQKQEEMLDYMRKTYGQEFTVVEFIPAPRGFNDSMNESILVVKNEDGFLVNVRERVGSPGYFYDNFYIEFLWYTSRNHIDYSEIPSLITARLYPKIRTGTFELSDLENGVSSLNSDVLINITCLIAVSGEPNDDIISSLYKVYKQFTSRDFQYINFIVAFVNDTEKSIKYVDNFDLYGVVTWDNFDSSIINLVTIQENDLSIEKFTQYF
ncbi:MAG: hypothetical protein FWH20_06990 [Oscillospiraceae bacterium]|nr:hypothetical protein [Oscillospiraceae bacterium]